MSGKAAGLENSPAPYKKRSFTAGSLPAKFLVDGASVTDETLKETSGSTMKSVPDVHVTCEGLPGHEFQGTSSGSDRGENYASARSSRPTIFRKLTLATGPLPLPENADLDSLHGMRRDAKQVLSGPPTLHKRRRGLTRANATHAQLAFVNSRGMC